MTKNDLRTIFRDLTEQKAPAAQIDLWPAIQSRVQMRQPRPSRGTIMNTQINSPHRLLKPALLVLAVVLIGALFFAFPQGRALAQEILHYFTRGESNLMPRAPTGTPLTWVEQTRGVAAATVTPQPPQPTPPGLAFEKDCGLLKEAHCSIEDIRARVAFPVFALSKLPDGMTFAGVTGSPDQVYLVYTTSDPAEFLIILEEPSPGAANRLASQVGADAAIQSVQVGAVTAEYVKGSYDGSSTPAVWNAKIDLQQLRWLDRGILFNFYAHGMGARLGRAELASLAAALTDGPLGGNGSPVVGTATPTMTGSATIDPHTIWPLTLAQAEKQAGFTLLSPSRLPEALSFIGANFDPATKVVRFVYSYADSGVPTDIPHDPDSFMVSEQLAPKGMDCDLCGFVQGTGKQVDQYPIGKLVSKDAAIETVQIGNFTGEYVEGIGWTSGTDCCGWTWDTDPGYSYRKRLRFRTNDLAIEFEYDGYTANKADLIAIAEGMK
jgi:hypothetical protein